MRSRREEEEEEERKKIGIVEGIFFLLLLLFLFVTRVESIIDEKWRLNGSSVGSELVGGEMMQILPVEESYTFPP